MSPEIKTFWNAVGIHPDVWKEIAKELTKSIDSTISAYYLEKRRPLSSTDQELVKEHVRGLIYPFLAACTQLTERQQAMCYAWFWAHSIHRVEAMHEFYKMLFSGYTNNLNFN